MNILIDGQTLETEEINRGIGVYFKNVLSNMVKYSVGNIWYIAISSSNSLNELDEWIANRLNPIINESFAPSFEYAREEQFTDSLNIVIEKYHIDCLWTPNPLMVNVLFPSKEITCPFFATIHDLIPFVMPIKEWSETVRSEYLRRLDYLADVNMICVSSATERDLRKKMGNSIRTFVTLEAADNKLFYRKRENPNQSNKIKIVFTGGFDYRKNIYGAIEAFAIAKRKIKDKDIELYIVCKYNQQEKEKFDETLKTLGISACVHLTGYISNNALAELYHTSDVFFFPSFYEGFGLPLLEAMLGGAYILSANNSSLPEVCGDHALYCDANQVGDMAEKLEDAINQSLVEGIEDKWRRQQYALQFSWKKTAEKTFEIFESVTVKDFNSRKKIAIATPWPNQQTGIANYIYRLLPYLTKYFDIDVFVDNTLDETCQLVPNVYGGRYLIGELAARHQDYDEIIYQLGNSTKHHSEIYKMFKQYNGIAEIHDFVLNPFFYHSYYMKGDKETYRQALVDGYGMEGEKHYYEIEQGYVESDASAYPMSCSISNIAKKTIVHNEWSYRHLSNVRETYYIPHMAFENDMLSKNVRRKAENSLYSKIGYRESEILIGCFGWVNANKRPEVVLRSVLKLKDMGYPVKLVFFGKNNYQGFANLISEFQSFAKISGFLEREEYQIAMERCDIVVNLRYPSMGEASGTLCEAFKAGKPVIVTATNQYLEFPDEVCWKLPLGESETMVLVELLKQLIDFPELRRRLGENAKSYAENVINGENIAKLYYKALT